MPRLPVFPLVFSLALYVLCLSTPAFFTSESHRPCWGYDALASGGFGTFYGYYSWWANPLYLLALICCLRPVVSGLLAALGLAIALTFLRDSNIPVNEAPSYQSITAYGVGYAFWIAALASLAAAQLTRGITSQRLPVAVVALLSGGAVLGGYGVYYFSR